MEKYTNLIIVLIIGMALLGSLYWLIKLFLYNFKQRQIHTRLVLGYKLNKPFIPESKNSEKKFLKTTIESNYLLNEIYFDRLNKNAKTV